MINLTFSIYSIIAKFLFICEMFFPPSGKIKKARKGIKVNPLNRKRKKVIEGREKRK
jgi:hypothetical protein